MAPGLRHAHLIVPYLGRHRILSLVSPLEKGYLQVLGPRVRHRVERYGCLYHGLTSRHGLSHCGSDHHGFGPHDRAPLLEVLPSRVAWGRPIRFGDPCSRVQLARTYQPQSRGRPRG